MITTVLNIVDLLKYNQTLRYMRLIHEEKQCLTEDEVKQEFSTTTLVYHRSFIRLDVCLGGNNQEYFNHLIRWRVTLWLSLCFRHTDACIDSNTSISHVNIVLL
jgi:hypothetical protein